MRLIVKLIQDIAYNVKVWLIGRWSAMNFSISKSQAIRLAGQYNRKYYVIQSSPAHWQVFSTADVRHLKKTGIFKKNLTWKEMTEKSAFVAYPEKSI